MSRKSLDPEFLARLRRMGDRPKAPAPVLSTGQHSSPAYDDLFDAGRDRVFEQEEPEVDGGSPGDRVFGDGGHPAFGDSVAPVPEEPMPEARFQEEVQAAPDQGYDQVF